MVFTEKVTFETEKFSCTAQRFFLFFLFSVSLKLLDYCRIQTSLYLDIVQFVSFTFVNICTAALWRLV